MYVCHGKPCVVARGQLSRVCSLLPPRESGNPTRVIYHNWQQALLPTELSHRPRTISLIFYLLCQSMCTSSVVFLHKDSIPLHKMTVDSKDWQGCGGKGCVVPVEGSMQICSFLLELCSGLALQRLIASF